ncbi:MAG: Exocyst complex component 4 [Cirrosporium novae-zelandiae]|nr:MAG: Exocyst complex component 4 [Cirrosporium novae-zelandiae]
MSRAPPDLRPRTPNGYYNRSRSDQDSSGGYGGFGGPVGGTPRSQTPRVRRDGGYGGISESASSLEPDYARSPDPTPRAPDMQSGGGNWRIRPPRTNTEYSDSSRGRDRGGANGVNGSNRSGEGTAGKRIEGVLQQIQQDWDFMTQDDCVPVQVAMLLMDNSTIGKADRYPEFQQTNKQLQKALRAIVNEHHQGFNSSIGTFHKIQSSIQSSQNRVRVLKDSLMQAKLNLLTSKPELKGLATSSQNYDDMLGLLNKISQLQAVPEQLDARISEKRFLGAVDILQDALQLIRRSELENIGALSDLRLYFSNQEMSLTDILIEELHDHLYLKSPYCQNRWKPAGQKPENPGEEIQPSDPWGKPLENFLNNLDTSVPMVEDASRNPEADSFYYIQVIIESLHRIGRLEIAIDRIEQRLPVELFGVVDKTNAEVDSRHPSHGRKGSNNEKGISVLSMDDSSEGGAVLSDLLWTLYSKFEAIAESHRVVHDVVAGIVKRDGLHNVAALTGGFKELWKLYQSEIRSLLHDYLATDANTTLRSGQTSIEGGNIFRQTPRDKNKKMFKLSDIDQSKSEEMTTEQEDLNEILKSSVPGLISTDKSHSNKSGNSHGNGSYDNSNSSGTGHKLLVEPSVFNMSLLLPPSLSFLQRLKELVPLDSDIAMSTLTSFLDDFLMNVFHPQLEEAISDFCGQSFIELDAFQSAPNWSQHAKKPIFRGTITFVSLTRAFCKMLNAIPHDQVFSQLVITQMATYYDKCCGWYKSLVTRADANAPGGIKLKAAAAFAEAGEIHDVVTELCSLTSASTSPPDDEAIMTLLSRETNLLITTTSSAPLESYDIISDPKTVIALSLLHNSMQWLYSRLSQLQSRSSTQAKRSSSSTIATHTRRWTYLTPSRPSMSTAPIQKMQQQVYLPMDDPLIIGAFNGILSSIQELSTLALATLHLDLRCGLIHMLTRAMTGPYTPATEPQQAHPAVRQLVRDLVSFDENVADGLWTNDKEFITRGLARLADAFIIEGMKFVPRMNSLGSDLMDLNLLVLQQNLKNIEASSSSSSFSTTAAPLPVLQLDNTVSLPRSTAYLSLFRLGATELVTRAKEKGKDGVEGFGYEEMKVLVELAWNSSREDDGYSGGTGSRAGRRGDRELGNMLLGLSEGLWDA